MTDDESWLERSIYGWSKVSTPHFDRVAQSGILCTRAYTSSPSCAPSRASFLTGRNFWELEAGAFIQAHLPAKFTTLPDLMEKGGYFTGFTGKGYGPALQTGRTRNPAGTAWNTAHKQAGEGLSAIDYPANFDLFLAAKPAHQPFFFWCGTSEPHAPYGAANHEKLLTEFSLHPDDIKVPPFLPDTAGVRRERAKFAYEICHVDRTLGRILSILEARGELQRTLVIVTADNGTAVTRSKSSPYDWGSHVPMAVMWPDKIKSKRRVDDFLNFADMAPTILAAAALPIPPEMSGRSALDTLLAHDSGQLDPTRSWTVSGLEWHGELPPMNKASRMIRDARYQYIVHYHPAPRQILDPRSQQPDAQFAKNAAHDDYKILLGKHPDHPTLRPFLPLLVDAPQREELYDCLADPFQLQNSATEPEYAAVKAQLKAQLETYQRQTKDPRITGEMGLFTETRATVQDRKRRGYKD